jgi:general stress protein 26
MELKKQILDVLKRSEFGSLATIGHDGKPWVRYMAFRASDDLIIRTSSHLNSRKVSEIQKNPQVHLLCGVKDFNALNSYLQVQATATIETSTQEKSNYWTPFLKRYFKSKDDPNYAIIIIRPYYIEYMHSNDKIEIWKSNQK